MTSPTATITGRVVGPDGLGRLGRITFTPASLGAPLPARDIVAGRASFRIDPDGYLVGQTGRTATVSPGNYEIDLNIPGDLGAHIRTVRSTSLTFSRSRPYQVLQARLRSLSRPARRRRPPRTHTVSAMRDSRVSLRLSIGLKS